MPVLTGWQLGHRPALDGLRGVAVLMVVFGHLFTTPVAFAWLGHPGVTIFFVLSGFLITSLLVEERERTGRVALSGFYARRARRLGPALLVVVSFVVGLSVAVPRYANWPVIAGALTWSTNWVTIGYPHFLPDRYSGHPGFLGHTWSLSIEEQFYLVWPVLLIALFRLGRRAALVGAIVGTTVSAALPLTIVGNSTHIQYGTDTRAASLLTGCALSLWMHSRSEGETVRPAPVVLLTLIVLVSWLHASIYRIENTLVSLLTAALIWAVAQGSARTFLDADWLRLIGHRSYGLYLWHVPIYWLVALNVSPSPWALALIAVPLAWLMTTLSWHFVERPFTRRRSFARPVPSAVA